MSRKDDSMFRALKLRQMEVVSLYDARRLGFIYDVEINENDGSVRAIIVRPRLGLFGRLIGKGDYIIPWENIAVTGRDLVLVKLEE